MIIKNAKSREKIISFEERISLLELWREINESTMSPKKPAQRKISTMKE